MTQLGIVTDLNRCVGCLACTVGCKMINDVPVGNYWNKTLRIGPSPKYQGAGPDAVDMYFLTVGCQHCANPACVEVCPTEASHKLADGTVQVDKEKCIGCQFCAMACPYGVRYLNEEERVVEKCTLCEQRTVQGELPLCVDTCVGLARWFGDLESGDYSQLGGAFGMKMGDVVEPYNQSDVRFLPDVGNKPVFAYVLRDMAWIEDMK
ncbi:4Fe-4S dicluster domain-containing protein [Parvibacter caecicola]|uniref:4Fe-4S dicluster domain-containing protein n=1 Tax=Parvibacter caecicola TaxID=747645 RepID=UPI00249C2872|nr:4Fe-4S dicluster domain-containing protein [Parvibacter caecicola]